MKLLASPKIGIVVFVFSCIIVSCGSNNDEQFKIEKEKLELEKQKIELEREKLNSSNKASSAEQSPTDKTEERQVYASKPSENNQVSVLRDFYRDFDNAFDYSSMNDYINRYYNASLRSTYSKTELPSYNAYVSKEHEILDITLIRETNTEREFKVTFYFNYEKSVGGSRSNKCADIITLDNGNKIIARREIGRVN
jgi:hypothetical protein